MAVLQNNNHSVFALHFHLILVTKYRKKVIDESINERALQIFEYIGESYHITVEEWNYEADYIHILFSAHPNSHLSKFINAYKSASSRLIKKEFPEIKESLWKEYFWSRSYCLISCGDASMETIKHYIERQGGKHDKTKSIQVSDKTNE